MKLEARNTQIRRKAESRNPNDEDSILWLTVIDCVRDLLGTWKFAKIDASFGPQFRYPTRDRSNVAQLRSANLARFSGAGVLNDE